MGNPISAPPTKYNKTKTHERDGILKNRQTIFPSVRVPFVIAAVPGSKLDDMCRSFSRHPVQLKGRSSRSCLPCKKRMKTRKSREKAEEKSKDEGFFMFFPNVRM